MKYTDARSQIKTGDIAIVSGKCFLSKLIRLFTLQTDSHVMMFWWWNDGLYLAGMNDADGFAIIPASQLLVKMMNDGDVKIGIADNKVHAKPDTITDFINKFRALPSDKKKYPVWLLLIFGWLRILKPNASFKQKVCSSFVASAWKITGIELPEMESPGDLEKYCECLIPLEV